MSKFFFVLLLASLGCAHTFHPDRAPAQVTGLTSQDQAGLRDILARRMFRLSRPMVTFHYEKSIDSHFDPRNYGDLQTRMRGYAEIYFDINKFGLNVGPGEYVAVDPMTSRNYGGATPQLTVVTIPANTLVLNASDEISPSEQAWFNDLNQRMQCAQRVGFNQKTFDAEIGKLRGNDVEACRRLIINVIADLKIAAILYDWGGSNSLTECRHSRYQCVDIIRTEAIDLNSLAFYDDTQKIEAQPIAGAVAKIYAESDRDPTMVYEDFAMPASLKGSSIGESEYHAWKAKNIFKCGAPWSGEGKSRFTRVEEFLFGVYQDPEVLDAIKQLKDAIRARDPHGSSDVSHLKRLAQLQFKADKVNLSFADWTDLTGNLLNHQTDDAPVDLIGRLGEAAPPTYVPQNRPGMLTIFSSRLAKGVQSPAVLPLTLRELGYGPRFARLQINNLILSMGGVPFLLGPLPGADDAAAAANYKNNRERYLDILRSCAVAYADRGTDSQTIARGPCAIL